MRSKSGPGGTLYHYGFCELAQRQAVLVRKYKSSDRAIKSDRAKVAMTVGCISKTFDIPNYIYNSKERRLVKSEFMELIYFGGVLRLCLKYFVYEKRVEKLPPCSTVI